MTDRLLLLSEIQRREHDNTQLLMLFNHSPTAVTEVTTSRTPYHAIHKRRHMTAWSWWPIVLCTKRFITHIVDECVW